MFAYCNLFVEAATSNLLVMTGTSGHHVMESANRFIFELQSEYDEGERNVIR